MKVCFKETSILLSLAWLFPKGPLRESPSIYIKKQVCLPGAWYSTAACGQPYKAFSCGGFWNTCFRELKWYAHANVALPERRPTNDLSRNNQNQGCVEIIVHSVMAPDLAGHKMHVAFQNTFEAKVCKTRNAFNTGNRVEYGFTIQVWRAFAWLVLDNIIGRFPWLPLPSTTYQLHSLSPPEQLRTASAQRLEDSDVVTMEIRTKSGLDRKKILGVHGPTQHGDAHPSLLYTVKLK